jgi:hypothetical protein
MSPQRGDGIGGCLISFNATFPSRASTRSRFSGHLCRSSSFTRLASSVFNAPTWWHHRVACLLGNLRFPAASALPAQVMPSSHRPDDQAFHPNVGDNTHRAPGSTGWLGSGWIRTGMFLAMTINTELLLRTLEQIERHPELWNQRDWCCGTSHCFEGWAVTLAGGEWIDDQHLKPEEEQYIPDWPAPDGILADMRAMEVLGVSLDQAIDLFDQDNTLEDLRLQVKQLVELSGA